MNILKKTILILLVFYFKSFGQIKPGAKQISLSHSGVALASDSYALFNNPAGLSQQNWREFSFYYSPSPFGISKLANGAAVYHEPTIYGSFAIAYTNYGFDLYKENNFFIAYSNRFLQNFFAGITVSYKNLSIKNYGNNSTLTILLGGIALITKDFRVGFAIDNITRSSIGKDENQIPMIFNFGLSYTFLSKLIFNAAIKKEINLNTSLRVGFDYQIIKYFNLRIGAMNEPSSFSAGVGINYSKFEIDYAFFNHQDLGFTHQIGISLQFSDDKSRIERINQYLVEE
jgi:hypothetical protein